MQTQRSSSPVVPILVGIYLIVQAIFLFCVSAAFVGCGGFLGGIAGLAGQAGEAGAAVAIGGAGFLTALAGILGIGLGVADLAVAIGLFLTKPWAYMGSIVANAVFIGLQLLIAIVLGTGFDIWQIVLIVLSGVAIYFLLTDEPTKQVFGQA